ncbi:MAG: carbon starvation protein A [Acidobacteriota bacterium]
MEAAAAALGCLVTYFVVYRLYARFLGREVFRLDPTVSTPATVLRDDVDYVPTNRYVLFGHHYASIAGLSPMLGPAIAVIWGWLPGMLWVVFGTLFIGAVHDFSALVLSMRARGMSIGKVAEDIIGPRAKTLFHILIFFLVSLAMGVFVFICATLFTSEFYPQVVIPTFSLMAIALVIGWAMFRRRAKLGPATAMGFLLMMLAIAAGLTLPGPDLSLGNWSYLLLGYAFLASVLPVWLLLQPRDYINSLLLYLGLGMAYLGFFWMRPQFMAPTVQLNPPDAPPIFPFVFIVIACGAISGFHGLVASGTTSKQISRETDAVFIGYGGMIGESLLGLISVLACTAGFASTVAWNDHYRSWDVAQGLANKMKGFIDGAAMFVNQLGIPLPVAQAFIALIAVSFALTTLDSGTRLLRYNISEISETLRVPALHNRYVASLLAVGAIGFFAFFRVDGQPAGMALWQLFGTTNQIMGALTLLTVTLYLIERKRNFWVTLVPMVFMMVTTVTAMVIKIGDFWKMREITLLVIGVIIFFLSLWLVGEALGRLRSKGPGAGEKLAEPTS